MLFFSFLRFPARFPFGRSPRYLSFMIFPTQKMLTLRRTRVPVLARTLRAVLYGATVFLSFFLMLVFMTYNVRDSLSLPFQRALTHPIFLSYLPSLTGVSHPGCSLGRVYWALLPRWVDGRRWRFVRRQRRAGQRNGVSLTEWQSQPLWGLFALNNGVVFYACYIAALYRRRIVSFERE